MKAKNHPNYSPWLSMGMRLLINGSFFIAFILLFVDGPIDPYVWASGLVYIAVASYYAYGDGFRDALRR